MNRNLRGIRAGIAAALSLSILLILSSCGGKDEKKNTTAVPDAKETLFAVNTAVAVSGTLNDYLEFGGDVVASSSVDIIPDTSGKLSALYVAVGDTVTKNQVIGLVDPSRPGMTYSPSPLKSPIAGTITSLPIAIGTTVAPSMSIGKVSDTSKLEIVMNVPERYVSRIKMNQTAYLTFDAYPGQTFIAKVTKISPVLDPVSRTMSVSLKLDPSDSRIKAGMFAKIKLITDERSNIVIIPYTAVVTRQGEQYVFVVENMNRGNQSPDARQVKVKMGIRVDDKVEILSGISAGDVIVVKGQNLLDDGAKLSIVHQEEGK